WEPLGKYLAARGVDVFLGQTARALRRDGRRWIVDGDGPSITADAVIAAVTVPALTPLVADSPAVDDDRLREQVSTLAVTRPFAVWRLWLDRPTAPDRAPFAGTTGHGHLDNISLFHLLEDESRAWAEAHDGAVVELHAYACPPDLDHGALRSELLGHLHALYPETRDARIVEDRFLWRRDCPAFAPGSDGSRPKIETAVPGFWLCGDFVRLPAPSALMERAATSGMLAANAFLATRGIAGEPVAQFRDRGILARRKWPRYQRAS
ncbi:MAG TPA: FAD-dependent oxidoreductase, partial [Kofleriaceae bacterium]|nr:FAD-dependent oxidoreductase [Kofleriaceae bacterium]